MSDISEQDLIVYVRHGTNLRDYAAEHGLRGLESRLQRGLDPAGMLAVSETKKVIEEKFGDVYEKIVDVTDALHVGAIWSNASDLAAVEKREIKAWMLMAYACHEVNDKDLTPSEYVADFRRVEQTLRETDADEAVNAMRSRAAESFVVEQHKSQEIPFSTEDAFLFMAMLGHKSGVVQAGDIYFVGADSLDFETFAKDNGLSAVEKEDHGRMCRFYQKGGADCVKQLYPGFAIVFTDKELAMELATYSR